MDFQTSLDYLYGLQLFGIKLGLENMRALKARLPLLQDPLPCIHVAGTNGKGSVSITLAEILKQSGLRVGLYTSPHLHCFTERIRIDNLPITRDRAAVLAESIRQAAGDLPITFFEATTAMALLAFNQSRVDIAVIETGLGGRLDATNIVEPRLCLITPISLDHCEHLGSNLADIAAEKAGIIKPGIPVVVGHQAPEAAEVILQAAASRHAEARLAGRDFFWQGNHDNLCFSSSHGQLDGLRCRLAGTHQLDNLAQAVAAALQLRTQGYAIPDCAIRRACETVSWPGRLEWLGSPRRVLLDVAHNLAGISSLADYLVAQNIHQMHLVTGMSGARKPEEVLMPLVKFAGAVYAVPVSFGQSVRPSQIVAWAREQKLSAAEYPSAGDGLAAALASAGSSSPVVVCGSLYLVAELRRELLES
ncbi:MAG: bifunctional folylpolyglutamate synthase/dihydrofolate synthase [Desulfuromonadales bacterium]